MKKIVLTLAVAAFTFAAQAQILKNNFLKGYKEGDKLEKSVYSDKGASIAQDTWCGAFSSNVTKEPNPVVGAELSYEGYPEKGLSITFGGYPAGTKGARMSVYSMTDGRRYGKGTLYLSFLVNFSKLGANGMADFLGLSASFVSASNRANVYVAREGSDRMRFGTSLLKLKAETTEAYDLNKTHLLVLKLDYDNQKVSLFVDPALGAEEPAEAACIVNGDEGNVLKHAIRAVSFRNRSGYIGNIGNFRWCNSWAGITASTEAAAQ
ncbi:hypothetical protein [uncultured Bacteroides sp.]|uniref:hypothetical protein n=1 Tax=uncultured Bacteroides sp. TaxID=162156 RepID=UPI0025D741F4|nr:hypothetical protein [uncultured Bacteroides sp.]